MSFVVICLISHSFSTNYYKNIGIHCIEWQNFKSKILLFYCVWAFMCVYKHFFLGWALQLLLVHIFFLFIRSVPQFVHPSHRQAVDMRVDWLKLKWLTDWLTEWLNEWMNEWKCFECHTTTREFYYWKIITKIMVWRKKNNNELNGVGENKKTATLFFTWVNPILWDSMHMKSGSRERKNLHQLYTNVE